MTCEVSSKITWDTPLPNQVQEAAQTGARETAKVFTYLVNAPDVQTGSNRDNCRLEHLEGARRGLKTGRIINAGACLGHDPSTFQSSGGNVNAMTGSWLLVRATSLEEAREMCLNDVYTRGGVWAKEEIRVTPVMNLVQADVPPATGVPGGQFVVPQKN